MDRIWKKEKEWEPDAEYYRADLPYEKMRCGSLWGYDKPPLCILAARRKLLSQRESFSTR